jgi:hypothetical protein
VAGTDEIAAPAFGRADHAALIAATGMHGIVHIPVVSIVE